MIKNKTILKLLCEMNIDNCDSKTIEVYEELIESVKDNIRTATNRAANKNTLAKNAKAIIKNAIKVTFNQSFHGAWIDKNGKQYVCDGFRILEINEPIELPELPNTINRTDYFKAYEIIEKAKAEPVYELKIPTVQELKAEIKIAKSQFSGKKNKCRSVSLTLIDKGLTLNAQYLLELSEALGGVETIYVSEHKTDTSPVFMTNEVGLGFLLPINNIKKKLLKGYLAQ